MPAPAPYHDPMQPQPIGAGQSHTSVAPERGEKAGGARKKPRNRGPSDRKRRFLREFRRVGTLSAGRRAAGVSYLQVREWFEDEFFRQRFREAKLAFRDRLEELLMERIVDKQDGPSLRLKIRAEIDEKYGARGMPNDDDAFVAMLELERGILGSEDVLGG